MLAIGASKSQAQRLLLVSVEVMYAHQVTFASREWRLQCHVLQGLTTQMREVRALLTATLALTTITVQTMQASCNWCVPTASTASKTLQPRLSLTMSLIHTHSQLLTLFLEKFHLCQMARNVHQAITASPDPESLVCQALIRI